MPLTSFYSFYLNHSLVFAMAVIAIFPIHASLSSTVSAGMHNLNKSELIHSRTFGFNPRKSALLKLWYECCGEYSKPRGCVCRIPFAERAYMYMMDDTVHTVAGPRTHSVDRNFSTVCMYIYHPWTSFVDYFTTV